MLVIVVRHPTFARERLRSADLSDFISSSLLFVLEPTFLLLYIKDLEHSKRTRFSLYSR